MLSEDERDDLIADNNFQQGRDYERQRIIALLETQRDKHWVYNEVGHADAINQALALIKEENK